MSDDIERKLNEFENKLLEQEHRLIPIIQNIYFFRSKFKDDQEKKSAVIKSLIFRIFSPGTIAAAGIGIIGFLSFFVALRANYLFEAQNEKIDVQNYLVEAQRRSNLMFELTSILEQIQDEITQEHRNKKTSAGNVSGRNSVKLKVTPYTRGRIVALSRSLRPYRYLLLPRDSADLMGSPLLASADYLEAYSDSISGAVMNGIGLKPLRPGPKLTKKDMSPERGQLLLSLYNADIDLKDVLSLMPDFSRSVLDASVLAFADMSNINLVGSSITGSDLLDAKFISGFLTDVDFSGSVMAGVIFRGCMCNNVKFINIDNFEGAQFDGPENFVESEFTNSDLEGIIVNDKNWLKNAEKLGSIKGIVFEKWKIVSSSEDGNVINTIMPI